MVASEDERFYEHHGVDARGILRAALADYRHEAITQGASTITQQLARNMFLSNAQTLSRKIQEALLAIEIERYFTKDEILERYLNLIYFGAGAYGVQAAAHAYFGEDVSKISLPQAALLAGVVAAPSLYSPYADLNAAKARQKRTLDRMVALGDISQNEAHAAFAEPMHLVGQEPSGVESYKYPYYTTFVIQQLIDRFGVDRVLHDGLTVYTTLDPRLQKIAQDSVSSFVAEGAELGSWLAFEAVLRGLWGGDLGGVRPSLRLPLDPPAVDQLDPVVPVVPERPIRIGGEPVVVVAVEDDACVRRHASLAEQLAPVFLRRDVAADQIAQLSGPIPAHGTLYMPLAISRSVDVHLDESDVRIVEMVGHPLGRNQRGRIGVTLFSTHGFSAKPPCVPNALSGC